MSLRSSRYGLISCKGTIIGIWDINRDPLDAEQHLEFIQDFHSIFAKQVFYAQDLEQLIAFFAKYDILFRKNEIFIGDVGWYDQYERLPNDMATSQRINIAYSHARRIYLNACLLTETEQSPAYGDIRVFEFISSP